MDRLSALLMRLDFSADTFFEGAFCGSSHFPAQPGIGHLHLVRRGPATFTHDDGTRLRVDQPALVFYPRPLAHGLDTGAGTARLLCASVRLAGGGDAVIDSLPPCLHIPLAQLPAMAGVLELLFDEAQHGGLGQKLVLNRLCDVLIVQLLRHALASKLISASRLFGLSDAALAKALAAMHDHPGRHWTVASLATLCGMSRSRFAHQFHAAIGCPPAQYLMGQRMLRAQALLQQGRLVQDVALEVGYGSQPAFTRAFRASTRLSPRDWLAQGGN
ncbi:MAG: cupin domain-containing protein [Janthinobacterium svalbardensis]|uniref:AraC family transcriptional regulator n=1 Tax=Janthinobacterium svalbardensis TaxID=368607 RepID=A0A290WXE4_9BURK|nr:AraC family transcriptional regulator [Janthinobacterium svalbardensis]ATD61569.1 AraC family transcriptional regulator [Janthinobacterium svalbardensis]